MTYTTTAVQTFLSRLEPFNQLPEAAIAKLAGQLRPWRYQMGKVIVSRERMPSHVAIIYEGRVRTLGYDPRHKQSMPTNLNLLEPGSVLGSISLLRGVPTETAIASTEVICLTVTTNEFLQLLQKFPQIANVFRQQCSLAEVFDLIGSQLEQQARADADLKKLATAALAKCQVNYLPPGTTSAQEHSFWQNPNQIWLVSGGSKIVDFPIGSLLKPRAETITVTGPNSARLIGFPSSVLVAPPVKQHPKLESAAESVKVEVLPPEGDPIPLATGPLIEDKSSPRKELIEDSPKKQKYPHVHGKNSIDAGVACFQMLSQYFGMPFRKEVIHRVISEQIQRQEKLSLNISGAICELMGLNAQLVGIPASSLTRLNAPVLVEWQDRLAILYEIGDRSLVIGIPELGIKRYKTEEFLETWGTEGQVLLLKKTKETPQERFGLSWFVPSLIKYRGILLIVFLASFFVQLFALANPLMIQIIIDKVINQNSPDTLQVLGFFLLVLAIFEAVLGTLRTYLFVDTTNRIDMTLGSEIIDHLLRLPLRYFERRPVGEISTRVNELQNIRQFLTGTALTVVLDAIFSVIYIVVMFIYSTILSLVALGIIPIFVIMTLIFSPTIRRQLRSRAERNAETQSYLVEVMSGIQTVKAQNIELRSRWQWQERYARYVSAGFKTVITSTLAGSTSNFLNKLSGLLVLWVGAYLVLQGELTLGQLIAFRIIAGYVTSPILRLTQLWQNFQETALSLERLADIVDTPQEAEEDRQNIPMPSIKGAVTYENVSFRFKNTGPLNLNNVNLEIPAGTFVGIVGESGAGKSTLTKLLCRLYDSEAGRILIDGYDIHKVELYSLRRQIGVVPQETLLFDGTVQHNIALTNPDATTEEIVEAAQVAAAHEFIMNLPNGYNTRVGERGSALSGGQRQRIAIARSVLQRPQMLVLDEATSALDYATEQQVCHRLIETFYDRTVFFITHRLGTIQRADLIIMMDAGSIAEQGTHEELMALKGRYYYLYRQQESKL